MKTQLKTKPKQQKNEPILGYNDQLGNIFCNLCDWKKNVGQNMERMEMELDQHLRSEHGLRTLYRKEVETGKRTEIQ